MRKPSFDNPSTGLRTPLWEPSEERKNQANITRFIGFVNGKHRLEIDSYDQLWKWSVENIPDFWAAMWEFVRSKLPKAILRWLMTPLHHMTSRLLR